MSLALYRLAIPHGKLLTNCFSAVHHTITCRLLFVNASDSSQYLQLKLGKVAEQRADGTAEQGHAVNSLAAANPTWSSGAGPACGGREGRRCLDYGSFSRVAPATLT